MTCNKNYQKTIQQAYNNTAQAYTATGTTANILGVQCTDFGCSASTTQTGFKILKPGVYYVSYDITSTPGAAGAQILQIYKDSIALPCAVTTDTTVAGTIITQHVETALYFAACCASQPIITAKLSGVAGTINFVKATLIKQA